LHFAEDFETFEAGGLLEVGGDGAGCCAGAEEVFFGFDLCAKVRLVLWLAFWVIVEERGRETYD
jgi:hypothetical protein